MGKRTRSHWTDDESRLLRSLWGTLKDQDVANRLGKTISCVRTKATSMNLREEKGKRAGTQSGEVTHPWSKDEEKILFRNVGHSSIFELMEMLPSRTRASIESRCRRLGFSPTQGTLTRCGIERETGYDWRQIKRARDALGQSWKRYGVRKYIISEDQVNDITEYLKTESRQWSRSWNLDHCRKCPSAGTSDRERHSGDGLCKKCVSGDTRILVRNLGLVKISEMHGRGEFEVWSGLGWRETEVVCGGDKPTVQIETNNGLKLQVTRDHEILTGHGMVPAEMSLNRKVPVAPSPIDAFVVDGIVPRRSVYGGRLGDRFPAKWTREAGILMGWVMGDGSISKGKYPMVIIAVGRQDKADLDMLHSIVSGWCNTKSRVCDYMSQPNEYCDVPRPMSRVQWKCMALVQFMNDVGVDKYSPDTERRAPASIWTASYDAVVGFLSGIFASDGAVSINKANKIELSMSSVSLGFIEDIQQLLAAVGIKASIWKYPDRDKPLYVLSVFGIDNVKAFSSMIGFACERKTKQLTAALASNTKVGHGSRPLEIVSVTPASIQPVFDLVNVGSERQFVANGLQVSNCWDHRRYLRNISAESVDIGKSVRLTEALWKSLISEVENAPP